MKDESFTDFEKGMDIEMSENQKKREEEIPCVTVVIPVYNMEKYLDRCMESVLKQTLKHLEIILVDDGSKDQSAKICDHYAEMDARVKVIHKQNGGLTSAWKAGSKIATGEYIGYVDSDDYIMPDMYEKMYQQAKSEQADIACCGLEHVYETNQKEPWSEQMEFPVNSFTVETLATQMFPILINDGSFMGRHLQPNRVTKIVKRELVLQQLDVCADEVSVGEDFQFSLCMFLEAHKVVIVKDFFPYIYFMNDASMTMQYDTKYMQKIKIMKKNLCRISKAKGGYDFETQILNDFLCLTILNIKGGICKQKNKSFFEHRVDMKAICEDEDVMEAIQKYQMPKLKNAEKIFVFFIKYRMYLFMYMVIKLYFRS